jgi:hypothetical protein
VWNSICVHASCTEPGNKRRLSNLNASFVIALNPFCLRVSINYRRRRVGVLIVLKAKHTRPTERVFTYTHHRACSTINYTFIYARVHAQQVPILYIRTCRERGYVHTQRTSRDTCAALRLLVSFRSHIRVLFCFAAQLFDSNTLPACWCCSCDTSFCSILLGGTCRAGERAALRPCWRQEATQQRLKGFYCENSGKRAMKQC